MSQLTRHSRGFTLLEVLIALAILASALTILIGTMSTAGQQAHYANTMTQVGQLARSKMIDIEYELMDEGFQEDGQTLGGDFKDEGYDHIRWEATVEPVEIPPDVKEELIGQVNSQLFGGASAEGALQGNAAFSAMLPMLIGQVPEMINQIGQKIRRVDLTIYYEFNGEEEKKTFQQYVVDQKTNEFNLFGTGGESDGLGDDAGGTK